MNIKKLPDKVEASLIEPSSKSISKHLFILREISQEYLIINNLSPANETVILDSAFEQLYNIRIPILSRRLQIKTSNLVSLVYVMMIVKLKQRIGENVQYIASNELLTLLLKAGLRLEALNPNRLHMKENIMGGDIVHIQNLG